MIASCFAVGFTPSAFIFPKISYKEVCPLNHGKGAVHLLQREQTFIWSQSLDCLSKFLLLLIIS